MSADFFPVLVFACDRADYLHRALDALFANPDLGDRAIFVSQDGDDANVADVVATYGSRIEHLRFDGESVPQPVFEQEVGRKRRKREHGYMRIAAHYRAAFDTLFIDRELPRAIVLEDDLEIAPDFFSYIDAASTLMDDDPSVWTVSAWNDNSYTQRAEDGERLLRTDFFPGLGWLMTRALWDEYKDTWPDAHWDHWLRTPEHRRGRSVIMPEISRTYNFGREGTSGTDFYDRRLQSIRMNDEAVDFSALDLSYLRKPEYDRALREAVASALPVGLEDIDKHPGSDVKLLYHSEGSYNALAEHFGLMPDFGDARLPRASYDGVVMCRDDGRSVYLVSVDYVARGALSGTLASVLDRKAE